MDAQTLSKTLPDTLRVLFFDKKHGGITDSIVRRAVQDYTRVFLYSGFITHCAIQYGKNYYEVAMDGSVKMPFDESMLFNEAVVAYYEISLEGMPEEELFAAQFMLDQDVANNRRFNVWQSLTFLENYIRMGVEAWTDRTGVLPFVNYNIPPGTYQRRMGDVGFNLPFTCATQVANVFNQLFGLEPAYDCLLPEAMFFNLEQLAATGYGSLHVKDFLGV